MADADYHVTAEYRVKDLQSRAADLLAGIRPPDAAATPDGHKLWTVYAGAGSAEDGIDVMRFIGDEKLSIKAGDSVAFDMSKGSRGTFHTVTFLSGAPAPDVLLPGGQSGYPVNPKVLLPTPSAPYDGSLYASSGLMVSGGSTPQRWTVTFTRPGSWAYQCLLHAGEGMKGTIVVQ